MPPPIAALAYVLLILYLFSIDLRQKINGVSKATWLPLLWMSISGSREVSSWLNLGSPIDSVEAFLEGNSLDRIVYLALIVLGILVLSRRNFNWRVLFRKNIWILLFFVFGAISILWSDYHLVSLKRLLKSLGLIIIALVILTEESPIEALGVILRRFAFLLLPLSVLFIKYYPQLGRSYHWGQAMLTGVAMQKNSLGQICLISGIYFIWSMLFEDSELIKPGRQQHRLISLGVLAISTWLLYISKSATSLSCFVIAISFLLISRLPTFVHAPKKIILMGLIALFIFGLLEGLIGVSRLVLHILGRDPTLTNRVQMWNTLMTMAKNPIVGVGYESFWLGRRLIAFWELYGPLRQAHNGYLEIYLNLGLVGLVILVGCIVSGMLKVSKQLQMNYPFAILKLTFIIIVVISNWTEASYQGTNNMWLLLFLSILDTSAKQESARIEPSMGRQLVGSG